MTNSHPVSYNGLYWVILIAEERLDRYNIEIEWV